MRERTWRGVKGGHTQFARPMPLGHTGLIRGALIRNNPGTPHRAMLASNQAMAWRP